MSCKPVASGVTTTNDIVSSIFVVKPVTEIIFDPWSDVTVKSIPESIAKTLGVINPIMATTVIAIINNEFNIVFKSIAYLWN